MSIEIEMGKDEIVVMRNGYTLLDILSDIGGMYSILVTGFGVFLALFNFNHFDTYMTSRLFKI